MRKMITMALLATLAVSISGCSVDASSDKEVTNVTDADKEYAKQLEEDNSPYKWQYSSYEDEMTSEKTMVATIQSTDVAQFEFPYNGGSTFTLNIRTKGKKVDAWVQISKGQIVTDFSNPIIVFRADDNDAVNYGVSESSDYDPTIRFINNPTSLIAALKNCTSFKIQCPFFNEGSHVFRFANENFLN